MNTNDTWGTWAIRIWRKKCQLMEFMWTLQARVLGLYWQIQIGRGCRFWGKMHFHRSPNSQIQIGPNCRFRSAFWSNMVGINRPCLVCTLQPSATINIEDHCGFSGTVISAAKSIEIGAGTICGGNVTITDTDWHPVVPEARLTRDSKINTAGVRIGKNVWVGLNVIVLRGVTIGDNAVIAAGSIVAGDIPANVVAAGVPAKVIRHLQDSDRSI